MTTTPVRQAFTENGAWPICASCAAELHADGNHLVMAHNPACSQVLSIAAQARAS
jgi:hypothetical protein